MAARLRRLISAPLRAPRLGTLAVGRNNNFDLLRLAAAILVLASHNFLLRGLDDPFVPHGDQFGSYAVYIFFATSGFLVTASWFTDPSARRYLAKRCLRIFPALWISLVLLVLVLGTLVTASGVVSYLTSGETWSFLGRHMVLAQLSGNLPGVFTHNAYPNTVNGSLWTLPYEFTLYLAVPALVLARLANRWLLAAMCAASVPVLFFGQEQMIHTRVFLYFLWGATMYVWRDRLPLSWTLGAVLWVPWIALVGTTHLQAGNLIAMPYTTLLLAYRTPRWLRTLTRPGDVSYGVYIYAFPVAQLWIFVLGNHPNALVFGALTCGSAYALGLASWHFVERPALRLKHRVTGLLQSEHDASGKHRAAPVTLGARAGRRERVSIGGHGSRRTWNHRASDTRSKVGSST